MKKIIDRALTFGRMIKFSHTLFAMPFALTSVVLASFSHKITLYKLFWIIIAMVGARSAAMGFNRIADREFDARNPRTKNREIPTKKISLAEASAFVFLAALLLVFAAYKLNKLCFYLSPVALTVVFFYSFTKRFTWLSHIFLGLGMGLAPVGAWLGIAGQFSLVPILLGLTVVTWGAGFDIIYSCQDLGYDDEIGLFSMPRVLGVKKALVISAVLHAVAFALLVSLKFILPLGSIYLLGLALVAVMLIYQHAIVKPNDLNRLNFAFFNLNAYMSVGLFLFTLIDVIT
ncbi:MAG: putative 4-hydroxybenzoate polyprenyltransferase [Bacteroidetes bacterium]|nr:putative 4-hydroxybenzoate polyprenyltransferase [Bacteroidota bacterium]